MHPPHTVLPWMRPTVKMRAVGGTRAQRGVLDAGVESRHDVVGAHRSKERLSAPAQRGRAGLVVVSLQGPSHRYEKIGRFGAPCEPSVLQRRLDTQRQCQWLVPRAGRSDTVAQSSNRWLYYLKSHAGVVLYSLE